MKYFYCIFFIGVLLLFASCEEKVVEIVSVIETQDISIADTNEVHCFSFPSLQTGYAGLGNTLYKTTDAGKTWDSLSVGAGVCYEVAFFNEQIGLCSKGSKLYKTTDGGNTWVEKPAPGYFAGINNGSALFWTLSDYIGTNVNLIVYKSADYGETFVLFSNYSIESEPFNYAKLSNNRLCFMFNTFDDAEKYVVYVDLITGSTAAWDMAVYGYRLKDYCFTENIVWYVGTDGLLYGQGSHNTDKYDYTFYSVEWRSGKAVAVGDNSVWVNRILDSEYTRWYQTYDANGKDLNKQMRMVRFYDDNTFFIAGENGLLIRANF